MFKKLFRGLYKKIYELRIAYHWARMKHHQKHMWLVPAGNTTHRKHMEKYGKHHARWHRLTTGADFI